MSRMKNPEVIMTTSQLATKMKLKPGMKALIINAPDGYMEELSPLPDYVDVSQELIGEYDWIQIFVFSQAQLEELAPKIVQALKPESILWISFPKGTSKIQTDLTRDKGWEVIQQVDLKWINLISINTTWSAFSLRPYRNNEDRQSNRFVNR
jgi:hypothetical protein